MRIIARINEGESYSSAIIGWKTHHYVALDDDEVKSLKISLYLGFILIKTEFIFL